MHVALHTHIYICLIRHRVDLEEPAGVGAGAGAAHPLCLWAIMAQ